MCISDKRICLKGILYSNLKKKKNLNSYIIHFIIIPSSIIDIIQYIENILNFT